MYVAIFACVFHRLCYIIWYYGIREKLIPYHMRLYYKSISETMSQRVTDTINWLVNKSSNQHRIRPKLLPKWASWKHENAIILEGFAWILRFWNKHMIAFWNQNPPGSCTFLVAKTKSYDFHSPPQKCWFFDKTRTRLVTATLEPKIASSNHDQNAAIRRIFSQELVQSLKHCCT